MPLWATFTNVALRTFLPAESNCGAVIFGLGLWIGGVAAAFSLLVWGVFFRLVFVFHATWLVNSASHMWGYRNYDTRDNSRNLWWVALLTYGEGWHNNHHAYPQMARNRHKWWEFDLTFEVIRLLGATGLAWDIVDGRTKRPSIKPDVRLSPATAPQIGRPDACAVEEDSVAAWPAEGQRPAGVPAEIVAPVAVAP